MGSLLQLQWDVFKGVVDDLAACSSYGVCHADSAFYSTLNDVCTLCKDIEEGRAAQNDVEECADEYMAHLLQCVLYIEHSDFEGEKIFKSGAKAWLQLKANPENRQDGDESLWHAVNRFDEAAVPLFRAFDWRTTSVAGLGPSYRVGDAPLDTLSSGGADVIGDHFVELVLRL